MQIIDVGKEFFPRLANRDKSQGDGRHNAIDFRRRYLGELDNVQIWTKAGEPVICFDFVGVDKIAPSFANEAFAYFTKYAAPELILKVIKFKNISPVKMEIIELELRTGYEPHT